MLSAVNALFTAHSTLQSVCWLVQRCEVRAKVRVRLGCTQKAPYETRPSRMIGKWCVRSSAHGLSAMLLDVNALFAQLGSHTILSLIHI